MARFHLGTGARLERINFLADRSPYALKQSLGLMANYLYKRDDIETNHEAFAARNEVVAAQTIRKLIPTDKAPRNLIALPQALTATQARDEQKTNSSKEFHA